MSYRKLATVVVATFFVATAAVAVACSSSPEAEDEAPTEEPADVQPAGPDVVEAYQAGAQWLPRDVNAVAAGTWTPVWERLGDGLLPTALPDAQPGDVGTVEGLREDLREILSSEFGFDPTPGDTVVIGASPPQTVVAVVFGEFDEPADELRAGEVVDRAMYEFEVGTGQIDRLQATFVDEPRRGLVVAMDPGLLEASLTGRADDRTLAGSATGREFGRLFGEIEGATVGMAFSLGQLRQMVGGDQPIPESGVAGYRSNYIEAVLEGDRATLDQLEQLVSTVMDEAAEEYDDQFGDAEPGTFENITAIYGRHLEASVIDQLTPEIEDGRLRVDLELTDSPYQQYMWLGMAASLLVPAFAAYQDRAAAAAGDDVAVAEAEPDAETTSRHLSEPGEFLELAADGAAAYFEGDQIHSRGEGAEPWHDKPDEQPGTPVGFDDKTFPGGAGIEVETIPEVPGPGEALPPEPTIVDGDADFDPEVVFRTLNMDLRLVSALGYRIVYETGPGTGEEATATIRVQAHPERTDGETEQLVVELGVGSDLGVQRSDVRRE